MRSATSPQPMINNRLMAHFSQHGPITRHASRHHPTQQPRLSTSQDDETVLEAAAARRAITLAYGCRNGACGTCKGKVLEGTVDYGKHAGHMRCRDTEKGGGLRAVLPREAARPTS